jgi:hypothetical protein
MPNVLTDTADAVVTALAGGTFTPAISPVRSFAQWTQPFEVAESAGLRVDVVPVTRLKAELVTRGTVRYEPQTDLVIRKKFPAADLEQVPGDEDARVIAAKVEELLALLFSVYEFLVTRRLSGDKAWLREEILTAYMSQHLRKHHQYTGVIRLTHAFAQPLA